MTQLKPLDVSEIIQALRELDGEATWADIQMQVRRNRGTGHAHYKDLENFNKVINHYIQQHCSGFPYKKFIGPVYFEYVDRGRVRLAKHTRLSDNQISEYNSNENKEIDEIERIIREQAVIVRNLDLVRKIKRIYSYTCQICGTSIQLPSGKRYAEVHHIQPLGRKHNGPDRMGNMLCVCPNDHVRLHGGAMRLKKETLIIAAQHHLVDEYIEYHNRIICKLHR